MSPGLLIGELFANAARATPARVAVAAGGRTMDFAALEAASNRLARLLEQKGVGPADRIASWSSTSVDVVPLFAALAKLGAPFMPVSGLLVADEARAVFGVGRPALIVADAEHVDSAAQLEAPVVGLEALLEESEALSPAPFDPPSPLSGDHPHVVFFTSGSTGRPKGVVLSHETNYLRSHPGALPERRGAMVCPYPLFHMGAWTIALQQWQARDAVVLSAADAESICEAVERHRATRLNCIPAVWRRVLAHVGERGGEELRSLRFADTGTSATPPDLLEDMAAAMPGAQLRVFYGSTEAGTVTCLEQGDMARKPGSCGVPAFGVVTRLDGTGELWARSPTLFDGYLGDPDATSTALVDGWYRTGDLAEVDDEGFVSIVGRTGELIRTGGETVAPAEVEAVLRELPSVADVAVVGIPDDTWGEVICAAIVAASPGSPTEAEVRAHCRRRLARYKQPRRVEIVGHIPRTAATGQVQRRLLAEILLGR